MSILLTPAPVAKAPRILSDLEFSRWAASQLDRDDTPSLDLTAFTLPAPEWRAGDRVTITAGKWAGRVVSLIRPGLFIGEWYGRDVEDPGEVAALDSWHFLPAGVRPEPAEVVADYEPSALDLSEVRDPDDYDEFLGREEQDILTHSMTEAEYRAEMEAWLDDLIERREHEIYAPGEWS